jgi:hypothetical protein
LAGLLESAQIEGQARRPRGLGGARRQVAAAPDCTAKARDLRCVTFRRCHLCNIRQIP